MAAPPLRVMYLSPAGARGAGLGVFARMAAAHKLPGTEVHIVSPPDDDGRFTHIEYRAYEGLATRAIVRAARAAAREGMDGFLIGCFYDTALHEAREVSGAMPVVAPCLAACNIAATLANRFGVVVGRRKWVHQMEGVVRAHGHGRRLAGFYPVEMGVTEVPRDPEETRRRLIAAARRAVERDHAEAVILGCTMETGFYREVSEAVGVPVIDAAVAALKAAEYAALLRRQQGWVPSRRWSCEAPPEDEIARFGGLDDGPVFAAREIVPAEGALS